MVLTLSLRVAGTLLLHCRCASLVGTSSGREARLPEKMMFGKSSSFPAPATSKNPESLVAPPSCDQRRMEFLRQQPIVSLADGDSQTFIADFPQPRPEFDHAKLWSETCKANAIKKIKECMQRKNSAVSYIQVVVDQHGFLVII